MKPSIQALLRRRRQMYETLAAVRAERERRDHRCANEKGPK